MYVSVWDMGSSLSNIAGRVREKGLFITMMRGSLRRAYHWLYECCSQVG